MEILYEVLVVAHFIGLAALLGGVIVQLSAPSKVVSGAMLHGGLTQLLTGITLVGLAEAALPDKAEELNMAKIGIKLLILLAIVTLCWVNRDRKDVPTGLWAAIGLLTVANIGIAVLV